MRAYASSLADGSVVIGDTVPEDGTFLVCAEENELQEAINQRAERDMNTGKFYVPGFKQENSEEQKELSILTFTNDLLDWLIDNLLGVK